MGKDFHKACCLLEHDTAWNGSWQHEGKKNDHNDTTWGCGFPAPVLTSEKALAHNSEPRQLNCCFKIITISWLFFLQYTFAHLSCWSSVCSLLGSLAPPHYGLAITGSCQKPWQNNKIRQYWKQWNEIPSIHNNFFYVGFDHHSTFLATVQVFSQLSYCYPRGRGSMVESRKDYNRWRRR